MSIATNKGINNVIVPVHNCCHIIVLNFANKNAGSCLQLADQPSISTTDTMSSTIPLGAGRSHCSWTVYMQLFCDVF